MIQKNQTIPPSNSDNHHNPSRPTTCRARVNLLFNLRRSTTSHPIKLDRSFDTVVVRLRVRTWVTVVAVEFFLHFDRPPKITFTLRSQESMELLPPWSAVHSVAMVAAKAPPSFPLCATSALAGSAAGRRTVWRWCQCYWELYHNCTTTNNELVRPSCPVLSRPVVPSRPVAPSRPVVP